MCWALEHAATLGALWDAVRRKGSASLAGPIAIVRQASAEVKRSIADFARILANISVGFALLTSSPSRRSTEAAWCSSVRAGNARRKVNHRFESVVHVIGLLLLLALLLSVVLLGGNLQLGKRLFPRGG